MSALSASVYTCCVIVVIFHEHIFTLYDDDSDYTTLVYVLYTAQYPHFIWVNDG